MSTATKLIAKLKKQQAILAKTRDAIRDVIDEADTMKEDCSEAYDDIERAIDALSRLQ